MLQSLFLALIRRQFQSLQNISTLMDPLLDDAVARERLSRGWRRQREMERLREVSVLKPKYVSLLARPPRMKQFVGPDGQLRLTMFQHYSKVIYIYFLIGIYLVKIAVYMLYLIDTKG